MLRTKDNCRTEILPHFKEGEGSFYLQHIADTVETQEDISMFAVGTLPAGCSVGMHTHRGSMEICYFLQGTGKVLEKDIEYMIRPGDVSICRDGEQHQVINTGEEPLSYIVLVLKTKQLCSEEGT